MWHEINLTKCKSLFFIHCNTLPKSDQKYCLNPNATNAFLDNSAVVTAATNSLQAIGRTPDASKQLYSFHTQLPQLQLC